MKRKMEVTQQTIKFLEAILGASVDGILISDINQNIVLVNKAFCNFLCALRQDVIETNIFFWLEQFDNNAVNRWSEMEASVQSKGSVQNIIFQKTTRDVERYFSVSASILQLVINEERGVIVSIWRDITKQMQAKQKLRDSEETLRKLNMELEQRVEQRILEIKQAYSELDQIFNTVLPMYVVDKNYAIIKINDTLTSLLQINKNELIGKKCYEIWKGPFCNTPDCSLKQILAGKDKCEYEADKKLRDGRMISYIANVIPYRNLNGEVIGVIKSIIIITEHKKAEEELKATLKELKRSNAELEQFAYVASHDLQEPLRMVASFTQLLQNRYQDKLDDDANDFINYAVDGAIRMQNLISDLLIFSRVGIRGKLFKTTDMNTVLEAVINTFRQKIKETNTKITYKSLPVILADESLMIQLLQNLISNAIKFRSEEPPCIHVSGEIKADKWIFSVSDNGIGMESKYFDRVFVIFQRLHKKDEYEGTGIGLAVCKKIIQRHGGKIWVESKLGKGSTFYFSIPKKKRLNNIKIKNRFGIAQKNT